MAEVPSVESARLILRDWRDTDVEEWVRMNADPRIAEFLRGPYSRERSESSAREIRRELANKGYGWWVVEVRGVVPFAGVIVLQEVPSWAPFAPAYEVGWRFGFEHWGHGYATEGAHAALRHAFDRLGWPEVVAFTAAQNLRSRRVMERLGMTYDPAADFDHPKLELGHPVRRHVLYRIRKPGIQRPTRRL
ncbi:MAG: GNAT family N-acetyltransferase [Candidatus Cybelea sp.]